MAAEVARRFRIGTAPDRSCGRRPGSSTCAGTAFSPLAFLSRKAARWIAPVLALAAAVAALGDARPASGRGDRPRGGGAAVLSVAARPRAAGSARQALLFRRDQRRSRRGRRRGTGGLPPARLAANAVRRSRPPRSGRRRWRATWPSPRSASTGPSSCGPGSRFPAPRDCSRRRSVRFTFVERRDRRRASRPSPCRSSVSTATTSASASRSRGCSSPPSSSSCSPSPPSTFWRSPSPISSRVRSSSSTSSSTPSLLGALADGARPALPAAAAARGDRRDRAGRGAHRRHDPAPSVDGRGGRRASSARRRRGERPTFPCSVPSKSLVEIAERERIDEVILTPEDSSLAGPDLRDASPRDWRADLLVWPSPFETMIGRLRFRIVGDLPLLEARMRPLEGVRAFAQARVRRRRLRGACSSCSLPILAARRRCSSRPRRAAASSTGRRGWARTAGPSSSGSSGRCGEGAEVETGAVLSSPGRSRASRRSAARCAPRASTRSRSSGTCSSET